MGHAGLILVLEAVMDANFGRVCKILIKVVGVIEETDEFKEDYLQRPGSA